jgi:hypothetical protein
VVYNANYCVENQHPVKVVKLAVIHPETAAISVAALKLKDPAKLVPVSAAILKFNSCYSCQISGNQRALDQRAALNCILDERAADAGPLQGDSLGKVYRSRPRKRASRQGYGVSV